MWSIKWRLEEEILPFRPKSLQFGQENDKKHGKSEGNKPLFSTLNVPVRSEKMMKMGRKWMGADLHKGVIYLLCQSERKDLNGAE